MTIRFKLTAGYFVISLLVLLVGVTAIFELLESARVAAITEARNVAENIGGTVAFLDEESGPELFNNPAQLKRFAADLNRSFGRDIVVTNCNKRIMADTMPASVGTVYNEDAGGEVSLTMADGLARTFVEPIGDYPEPLQELVVPLRSRDNEIIGAIIVEYGPFYAEMKSRVYPVILVVLASLSISLCLAIGFGYFITRSVARPLAALRQGVLDLASGILETQVCVEGKGEIVDLAGRFNDMASARRTAETALREARDTLERRVEERTADLARTVAALKEEVSERQRAGVALLKAKDAAAAASRAQSDLLADMRERTQELSKANAELAERARLAALTADVGLALTTATDLQRMLQQCAEALVRHLGAAFARIWTLDTQGAVLELQASAGIRYVTV
jgi:methyl-accepting chemotaxis protein